MNHLFNFFNLKNTRAEEYKIFIYRLLLAYIFYFFARVCFYLFNKEVILLDSIWDFFRVAFFGIIFDSSAIIYVNLLFIVLSLFPFFINTDKKYQKALFFIYFLTNLPAYLLNFIDIVFFKINRARLTLNAWDLAKNEDNQLSLILGFVIHYWEVFAIFTLLMSLWIVLYRRLNIKETRPERPFKYILTSLAVVLLSAPVFLLGIRGVFFYKGTKPISVTDANQYAKNLSQVNLLLNTPFSVIRTYGKNNGFRKYHFTDENDIVKRIQPIKQYNRVVKDKPNVVLFILEGMGAEYFSTFNQDKNIPDFKSYTPFLDSLMQHSLYFTQVYANAKRSMEGITAITTGIPTFEKPFASTAYSQQNISSIANIYAEMGYETAFFHGATNGSMGFLGFTKQIGYQKYFGRDEFNNDKEHNGSWGIHDEPFLMFSSQQINHLKKPFLATIFTLSSHEPFTFPDKYQGIFNQGDIPMHNAVAYSDFSIKQFFEKSKHQDWFQNTIFCFVADHPAVSFYPYYHQKIAYYQIPFFLYDPQQRIVSPSASPTLAQQIDVFPTLVDLVGYNQPFRSWGRSLISPTTTPERAFVTDQTFYQMIQGNYIYVLDNQGNPIGIYAKEDLNLTQNLKDTINTEETTQAINDLKAFMQDFMNRILDRKLY